jgi:hypothetical protein
LLSDTENNIFSYRITERSDTSLFYNEQVPLGGEKKIRFFLRLEDKLQKNQVNKEKRETGKKRIFNFRKQCTQLPIDKAFAT